MLRMGISQSLPSCHIYTTLQPILKKVLEQTLWSNWLPYPITALPAGRIPQWSFPFLRLALTPWPGTTLFYFEPFNHALVSLKLHSSKKALCMHLSLLCFPQREMTASCLFILFIFLVWLISARRRKDSHISDSLNLILLLQITFERDRSTASIRLEEKTWLSLNIYSAWAEHCLKSIPLRHAQPGSLIQAGWQGFLFGLLSKSLNLWVFLFAGKMS